MRNTVRRESQNYYYSDSNARVCFGEELVLIENGGKASVYYFWREWGVRQEQTGSKGFILTAGFYKREGIYIIVSRGIFLKLTIVDDDRGCKSNGIYSNLNSQIVEE